MIWSNISGSAPLTAVQLLWVNMIMDTLGALALATEAPTDGLMKRPPVGRSANFITRTMWRNIIGQSIYQLAVLLVFTFRGKQLLKLTGSDAAKTLDTFIFNAFVFCQVLRAIDYLILIHSFKTTNHHMSDSFIYLFFHIPDIQ